MVTGSECPVCHARFRGARICSRCGADLEPLMLLAAQAWWFRESARRSFDVGDFKSAAELAAWAEQMQSTPSGEALLLLSSWLETDSDDSGQSHSTASEAEHSCQDTRNNSLVELVEPDRSIF